MHYRTNWALVVALALALHGGVLGGYTLLTPLLETKSEVPSQMPDMIEIENAPEGGEGDESDDPGYTEGEDEGSLVGQALPDEGVSGIKEADISSGPEAETDVKAVKAAMEAPPPAEIEKDPEPLTQEEAKVDPKTPDAEPIVAESEKEAIKEYQKQVEAAQKDPKKKVSNTIVIAKKGSGKAKQMGQPPITITDSYPPEGMYKFKGVIRVFTTIGTDGKVKATKISVTSGRRSADELAMAFCRRWTFKPALDGEGKPMESVKLIRIPFNLPPEKMKDQMDRNG